MLLEALLGVTRKIHAYHGSSVPIKRFDKRRSAQSVFWFSESKEKILSGKSGAESTKFIIEVILTVSKTAGWDEYENLLLDQLMNEGYDSVKLDSPEGTNWIIFDTKNIKVIGVEENKDLKEDTGMLLEALLESKEFANLKKNKTPLTPEEHELVISREAVWNHGQDGEPIPAVWKSMQNGKPMYVINTHRCWGKSKTLKGAINKYHRKIKQTA